MAELQCIKCGREVVSEPAKVAKTLRTVFDLAHDAAKGCAFDGVERAVFVEGFVRGALDGYAQRLEGACDHCAYKNGDEMGFLAVARASYANG